MNENYIPGTVAVSSLRTLTWALIAGGTILTTYLIVDDLFIRKIISLGDIGLFLAISLTALSPLLIALVVGVFLLVVASIADNLIALRWHFMVAPLYDQNEDDDEADQAVVAQYSQMLAPSGFASRPTYKTVVTPESSQVTETQPRQVRKIQRNR